MAFKASIVGKTKTLYTSNTRIALRSVFYIPQPSSASHIDQSDADLMMGIGCKEVDSKEHISCVGMA